MKEFYGKLQDRLEFISEPSSTAEDSRAKQAVAEKLMRVLRREEHKLSSSSSKGHLSDSIPTIPRNSQSETDAENAAPPPPPTKRSVHGGSHWNMALFFCTYALSFLCHIKKNSYNKFSDIKRFE